MSKVVVIYYHDIVERSRGHSYQRVEVDKFEGQMKYLREQGYKSLLFEDLEGKLPDKAVLVTFDDGFQSIYEKAVPIMRKYGIKGNIFLPTKYIDERNVHFMSWDQLKELCENNEFSVAGHTHTHVDIRTLDSETIRKEVEKSSDLIFGNLGIRTTSFCMPYGKYNVKSIHRLKENSDYKFIYASYYGHADSKRLANHVIPRIGVSNDDTLEVFAKKIEGRLNWKGILQRIRLMISNWKGERITQYEIE